MTSLADAMVCAICFLREEPEGMLRCNGCGIRVHASCHDAPLNIEEEDDLDDDNDDDPTEEETNGGEKPGDGETSTRLETSIVVSPDECFYCFYCSDPARRGNLASCEICPKRGGAMAKIVGRRAFAHVACVNFTPELYFTPEGIFDNVAKTKRIRQTLSCSLCKLRGDNVAKSWGCCVQCSDARCQTAFHAYCALMAGYAVTEGQIACPKHGERRVAEVLEDMSPCLRIGSGAKWGRRSMTSAFQFARDVFVENCSSSSSSSNHKPLVPAEQATSEKADEMSRLENDSPTSTMKKRSSSNDTKTFRLELAELMRDPRLNELESHVDIDALRRHSAAAAIDETDQRDAATDSYSRRTALSSKSLTLEEVARCVEEAWHITMRTIPRVLPFHGKNGSTLVPHVNGAVVSGAAKSSSAQQQPRRFQSTHSLLNHATPTSSPPPPPLTSGDVWLRTKRLFHLKSEGSGVELETQMSELVSAVHAMREGRVEESTGRGDWRDLLVREFREQGEERGMAEEERHNGNGNGGVVAPSHGVEMTTTNDDDEKRTRERKCDIPSVVFTATIDVGDVAGTTPSHGQELEETSPTPTAFTLIFSQSTGDLIFPTLLDVDGGESLPQDSRFATTLSSPADEVARSISSLEEVLAARTAELTRLVEENDAALERLRASAMLVLERHRLVKSGCATFEADFTTRNERLRARNAERREREEAAMSAVCLHCGSGESLSENPILLCEKCDNGAHVACEDLEGVPEGDWFCPTCTIKTRRGGGGEGRAFRQSGAAASKSGAAGGRQSAMGFSSSTSSSASQFSSEEEEESLESEEEDEEDEEILASSSSQRRTRDVRRGVKRATTTTTRRRRRKTTTTKRKGRKAEGGDDDEDDDEESFDDDDESANGNDCNTRTKKRKTSEDGERRRAVGKKSRRAANVSTKVQKKQEEVETVVAEEDTTEYCVCRRRYDPARMMIQCDECGEWYHPTCVGLKECAGGCAHEERLTRATAASLTVSGCVVTAEGVHCPDVSSGEWFFACSLCRRAVVATLERRRKV